MKSTSGEWRVATVMLRPPYADVPDIHIVGGRVGIVSQRMSAPEAAKKWADGVAGRLEVGSEPLRFSLLGDRVDAFWVVSGETWVQGRRATFPEYQVSWIVDGATNLVSSGELWEPLEDPNRHFANAWEAIYPFVLGLPYKPGTNLYLNGAAAVRLPYPVRLSAANASAATLHVRVDEDISRRAAGHSLHVNYRTNSEQTVPAVLEALVDSPRQFDIELSGPPVHWSVTLTSQHGVRRDFKEQAESPAPMAVKVPYPNLGVILGQRTGPSLSETREDLSNRASRTTVDATDDTVGADLPTEAETVAPDFSRISDMEDADLLAQRWHEAVLCLKVGASLSAIAMMGSLLEGALLHIAMRHPDEANQTSAAPRDGRKPRPWGQWRLNDLINVAVQAKWITVDLKDFSMVLRDYRNLLHPWESQAKAFHPTSDSAAICWEITRRVVDQLIAHEGLLSKTGRPAAPARRLAKLPRRSKLRPGSKSITDYVSDQRR